MHSIKEINDILNKFKNENIPITEEDKKELVIVFNRIDQIITNNSITLIQLKAYISKNPDLETIVGEEKFNILKEKMRSLSYSILELRPLVREVKKHL